MHPLSAQQMLAVWERGLGQIPLERALALLEAACPEHDRSALAAMSIGQRDAWLLRLREWAFGSQITVCAVCRNCGQPLELSFGVDDLRKSSNESGPEQVPLSLGGFELLLRPINSLDIASCLDSGMEERTRALFSRCLIAASAGGSSVAGGQVPDHVTQEAMDGLAKADPQADVEIHVSCEACHVTMRENFDIVSFFWSEIDTWARRMLHEIHILASAYGWKEADVLSLSQLRRQFYLEMIGA
jgi:hypothetical protein